jgi:hypothetical protein
MIHEVVAAMTRPGANRPITDAVREREERLTRLTEGA